MNNRTKSLPFLLLISVISALGLQANLAGAAPFAPQQTAQAPAKTTAAPATVPFELNGRHIILKGKVNSQPVEFTFDTGDVYSVVDMEIAKRLNLQLGDEIRVGGAGAATLRGAFVKDASFTLDGLPQFSQPLKMAIPLSNTLSPRAGRAFQGIIGTEFIQEFVVEIDYQARVLKLHDKEKFVYTGPGESIPIQLVQGHPILEAEVTPVGSSTPLKGKFVFDIGSGLALALHSPFVAENSLLGPDTKTIRALGGAGAGGETSGQIGRVSELKIGNYTIKSPIALFSEDKAGAFASKSLAGNIGARVANKFRVFLDYNRKRIIFEPNSTFAAPYDHSQAGMSMIAEGSDFRTFRIRGILENSPASEAGLQRDDIITAVNDQPAAQFTLAKLNEMFERPVPYQLTIRRGEQTLKVTLTPRRLI